MAGLTSADGYQLDTSVCAKKRISVIRLYENKIPVSPIIALLADGHSLTVFNN